MQNLNVLTKRLVDFSILEKELPIDVYEAIIKMTFMITFLHHYQIKGGAFSDESAELASRVLQFGEQVSANASFHRYRYGHGIHARNTETSREMHKFYWDFLGERNKYNGRSVNHFRAQMNLNDPIATLAPLQSQVDYLTYLTPFSQGSRIIFDKKSGSLAAGIHKWVAPLPLPLLATYHNMGILVDGSYESKERTYRDTPEAIQHDPESTLKEFEQTLLSNEIQQWRSAVEEAIAIQGKDRNEKNRFHQMTSSDLTYSASPFKPEARTERYKAVLKQQEEYLLRANQMGVKFSKEELTDLLSLLTVNESQKQILAFMEKRSALLANPAVRSFVQLVFFDPSLLRTMHIDYGDLAADFCKLMPKFLAEKIAEYKTKAEANPADVAIFVFYVQISMRLKEIYETLEKTAPAQNAHKYYSADFYPMGTDEIQEFLTEQRKKDPSSPMSIELIALQLKTLLAKSKLTQTELSQVVLDMQTLKTLALQASSFDYRELFWIKGSYLELIKECGPSLDKDHLHYVLDGLCHQKDLILDNSPWSGNYPKYSNAQYRVNLETGEVTEISSEAMMTVLPGDMISNPLFRKNFPELLKDQVKARSFQTAQGVTIYQFEDKQKNPCRAEKRNGTYTFYRSFPKAGHPEMLQAVSLLDENSKENSINAILKKHAANVKDKKEKPGLCTLLKKVLTDEKDTDPQFPAILMQRLFIDPKIPGKGYLISSEGDIQLEVNFERKQTGVKITNVIDVREGCRSEPMQLVSLANLKNPALKPLENIEETAHILVWGKGLKNGSVDKIELPRFGLQFVLKNGELICTTRQYAGYKVALSAPVKDKKGFAFSLLLEHPDRTQPKKLILPPAETIASGVELKPLSYSGLAYIIWIIKTLMALIFSRSLPERFASPYFHLKSQKETLNFTAIDLRPHTEEFMYTAGKETLQGQELILQSLKLGDPKLAAEVLKSINIEKDDSSLKKWIHFVGELEKGKKAGLKDISAAVGLKISEKIYSLIRGQKKYDHFSQSLKLIENDLFKSYLITLNRLSLPLKLNKITFQRIARQLKIAEPLYYQKHVAPYLMKVGETFTIAVTSTDGKTTKLPALSKVVEDEEEEVSEITTLEDAIKPEVAVDRKSLGKELTLLKNPEPLVFTDSAIAAYYDKAKGIVSEEQLLKTVVRPKVQELEAQKLKAQNTLHELLAYSSNALDQIAIFAKEKIIASQADLLMALLQNNFADLQKRKLLPQGIDLKKLKDALINFYEVEVKLHLMIQCKTNLTKMIGEKSKTDAPTWTAKSKLIWDQLTYRRQYTSEKNPELLAFEAFHFVTFRNSIDPTQLDLLQQLLKSAANIVQAGTGTGKSSVLSVLRGLMRANGTNLVTQKVLPHLFTETLAILQTRLGSTFKKKVYPLLFNQSMPLYDKAGNSLFAQMYQNLLETIQSKGCVLTDYKSFVLLEEKFFAINKQLKADRAAGVLSSPILFTHWFYLAKILVLLKNRDDQLMDEFDQPLSAVQRIQTQLREGPVYEQWKLDESLGIYDLLLEEKDLLLAQNLQADVPPQVRQKSIQNVAAKCAKAMSDPSVSEKQLYDYLTGESEDALNHIAAWGDDKKDKLAFLKDQFTTFLPLTLSRASISNYKRSKDGKKIVTCSKGEPREAKFGNPTEEINYSIQDYLQYKVALPTLRDWILDAKKDWCTDPQNAEKRFHDILPGVSVAQVCYLPPDDFEDRAAQLLTEVNKNSKSVRFFLKKHLEALRASGMVVSMNPQDSVAMSRAVSGVSATTGSLGSLHAQFETDPVAAEKIEADMIARMKARSFGPPIQYDPLNPLEVLKSIKDPRFCALIDGCGAFRGYAPRQVATALLAANPALKRVDYYDEDGKVSTVGDPHAPITEKGFYFPQAQTRGSDQVLRPDGVALQMADTSEQEDIEDFGQGNGRMRVSLQKVQVALSKFSSIPAGSLDAIIEHKKANKEAKNAEDRYRAEIQRMRQMVRHAAREDLLDNVDFTEMQKILDEKNFKDAPQVMKNFLDRFSSFEPLFIQTITEEEKPGDYFKKHSAIVKRNADPIQELQALQKHLLQECANLKIKSDDLQKLQLAHLQKSMPKKVLPLSIAEDQQQEVQEELEVNNQLQTEQEQEQQKESELDLSKVERYLPRLADKDKDTSAATLHKSFDPRIMLTETYLPLDRTDPLHKRTPFDDRMGRVGIIRVKYARNNQNIDSILIGDLLDHEDRRLSFNYMVNAFDYDLRTRKIIDDRGSCTSDVLKTTEFNKLIAQIKFMDGMTDKYTKDEIDALRGWLQKQDVEEMYRFFTQTICKHRREIHFPHSQLWTLFQEKLP